MCVHLQPTILEPEMKSFSIFFRNKTEFVCLPFSMSCPVNAAEKGLLPEALHGTPEGFHRLVSPGQSKPKHHESWIYDMIKVERSETVNDCQSLLIPFIWVVHSSYYIHTANDIGLLNLINVMYWMYCIYSKILLSECVVSEHLLLIQQEIVPKWSLSCRLLLYSIAESYFYQNSISSVTLPIVGSNWITLYFDFGNDRITMKLNLNLAHLPNK